MTSYHVARVVVEDAGLHRQPLTGILDTAFDGSQLFGFQVLVGLMSAHAVVQFGKRRHTQAGVVGGIDLPVVAYAVAGVHSRIEGEGHLVPRVLDGDEACREGEALQQDVVLQVERQVRAVQSV